MFDFKFNEPHTNMDGSVIFKPFEKHFKIKKPKKLPKTAKACVRAMDSALTILDQAA